MKYLNKKNHCQYYCVPINTFFLQYQEFGGLSRFNISIKSSKKCLNSSVLYIMKIMDETLILVECTYIIFNRITSLFHLGLSPSHEATLS